MDRSADGNGRTVNGQRPGQVTGDPNDQLLVVPVEVGDMSASLELWLPEAAWAGMVTSKHLPFVVPPVNMLSTG